MDREHRTMSWFELSQGRIYHLDLNKNVVIFMSNFLTLFRLHHWPGLLLSGWQFSPGRAAAWSPERAVRHSEPRRRPPSGASSAQGVWEETGCHSATVQWRPRHTWLEVRHIPFDSSMDAVVLKVLIVFEHKGAKVLVWEPLWQFNTHLYLFEYEKH